MDHIKTASAKYPVIDVIKKRWSARAFNNKNISEKDLFTIFEAASWAASANKEQPWQYLFARNGNEGFDKKWKCLMPGNQPWAKDANLLVVSIARKTIASNQKPNYYAHHDLVMANAHLLLQATAIDIDCHPMAGFDKTMQTEELNLDTDQEAMCVIALGYLADAETLEEPFKTRELTPRTRKTLGSFVFEI